MNRISEKPTKMRIVESLIGTLSGALMAMHSALKAAVQDVKAAVQDVKAAVRDSGCVRDEAVGVGNWGRRTRWCGWGWGGTRDFDDGIRSERYCKKLALVAETFWGFGALSAG